MDNLQFTFYQYREIIKNPSSMNLMELKHQLMFRHLTNQIVENLASNWIDFNFAHFYWQNNRYEKIDSKSITFHHSKKKKKKLTDHHNKDMSRNGFNNI